MENGERCGGGCMEKWFVKTKGADFKAWAEALGVDPVVARIIRNREVQTLEEAKAFLQGSLEDCHSPWKLKDMDLAVEHLLNAVAQGKKIRVIGDYDVDGICSSYILTKGIGMIGGDVDVAIPHRIHDGYGLNEQLIEKAALDGIRLIVTCDNGISASEQIAHARELGLDVIVTDHHEVPYEMVGEQKTERLPAALAVVDPKRADDTYPFSGICGAVVALKFMQAVEERLRERSMDAKTLGQGLEEFREFAALATVCDVMELKDENRIIVREGLQRMQHSRNQGLKALLNVCAIPAENLSAYHFGFVLGPCLNATGRLDTAQKALELLQSQDEYTAVTTARELKNLNDSRKNLTLEGVELARQEIAHQGMEQDKVLVVYLPEVHESLAGIIAGRIREAYGHPTFILTKGEDGVKGSGRSIDQYSMYEALVGVRDLLTKFGGHKLAAGLSLPEENVGELRTRLNQQCKLEADDFLPRVYIDMEMPISYPTLQLTQQIERLEPFGMGNARPLFVQRNVCFVSGSKMGKEGRFGRFQVRDPEGMRHAMVFFGEMSAFLAYLDHKYGEGSGEQLLAGKKEFMLHVVYQIAVNVYMGRREVQLQMKYYQ